MARPAMVQRPGGNGGGRGRDSGKNAVVSRRRPSKDATTTSLADRGVDNPSRAGHPKGPNEGKGKVGKGRDRPVAEDGLAKKTFKAIQQTMPKKIRSVLSGFVSGRLSLEALAKSPNTVSTQSSHLTVARHMIGHKEPFTESEIKDMVGRMVLKMHAHSYMRGVKAAALKVSPKVDPKRITDTMKGAAVALKWLGYTTEKAYAFAPEEVEQLVHLPPSKGTSLLIVAIFLMFRVSTLQAFAPVHFKKGAGGFAAQFPCEKGWHAKEQWRRAFNIQPPQQVEGHFEFVWRWGKSLPKKKPFVDALLKRTHAQTDLVTHWMSGIWKQVVDEFPRLTSHSMRRTGAQWHIKIHRWPKTSLKYVGGWASDKALKEYICEYIGLSEHLSAELSYLD